MENKNKEWRIISHGVAAHTVTNGAFKDNITLICLYDTAKEIVALMNKNEKKQNVSSIKKALLSAIEKGRPNCSVLVPGLYEAIRIINKITGNPDEQN